MEGIRYFVTSEWQFDDDGAASVETVHATAEDARAAALALAAEMPECGRRDWWRVDVYAWSGTDSELDDAFLNGELGDGFIHIDTSGGY